MSELETTEAIEILLTEKKKAGYKLAKAYDSYCLLPNEHDQEDWDNYSALVTALEMAVEALEKQVPKKPKKIDHWRLCPNCYEKHGFSYDYLVGMKQRGHEDISYCLGCGQAICWEVDEPDIPMEYYESGGK